MAEIKFTIDDRRLRLNIRNLPARIDAAVTRTVDINALRGMGYLKTDAPWTDRTGAARTGLHTTTRKTANQWAIHFAHSVHYGLWLEVKYSGRDAVIMPTIRKVGPELMADLRGLMRRL